MVDSTPSHELRIECRERRFLDKVPWARLLGDLRHRRRQRRGGNSHRQGVARGGKRRRVPHQGHQVHRIQHLVLQLHRGMLVRRTHPRHRLQRGLLCGRYGNVGEVQSGILLGPALLRPEAARPGGGRHHGSQGSGVHRAAVCECDHQRRGRGNRTDGAHLRHGRGAASRPYPHQTIRGNKEGGGIALLDPEHHFVGPVPCEQDGSVDLHVLQYGHLRQGVGGEPADSPPVHARPAAHV
mmetsp:Transcript_15397/g.29618  ORF Transcript_15397/g.29618 Transcript_15397/m.29618 type:complete len:239 (+) Transcript_15397:172-888(+)